MKKFLMYGLLLAGAALTSCQYTEMIDPNPEPVDQNRETRLSIAIDDMSGGIPLFDSSTRATVREETGEKNVTDLQLLFFNYMSDGSGTFAGKYDVPNEYLTGVYVDGEPFDLNIGSGTEGGANLSHIERYTILAYANMADLPDMSGKTEAQAREEIRSANYAAKFMSGSVLSLPMSGTTVKEPEQELVTLKLTRMVARLDVKNELSGYTLKSVSILNAATKSRIWSSRSGLESVGTQTHTGEAYGMTGTEITAQGNDGNIFGGLYAFSNFVGNPLAAEERTRTTALLVELQKGGDPIEFHRVDIHPLDEGQNLKKNHVYQATLKGVISKGFANKNDAINSTESTLDVAINNWGPEADEGLILNDGTNMLVAPTRYIKFGPEAESREYLIYTSGTGTLEITGRNLPNGITATLDGNTLIVEATALPDQEERSGTLELGFAGLRGSVQVVQSPDDNHYLNLDKKSLPTLWPAGGEDAAVTTANELTVSSSGPWKATIYNTSETNPGFWFEGGSFTATGVDGDKIRLVPRGPNPSNSVRQGFVMVELVGHEKYRQVRVMSQRAMGKIEITPGYTPTPGLPFTANGFAKLVGNGTTETFYRIDVSPGKNETGKLNNWEASLSGAHADYFTLTRVEEGEAAYVILSPKGQIGTSVGNPTNPGLNVGGVLDQATLTIMLEGGNNTEAPGSVIELPIRQDPMVFTVKRTGAHTRVPVMGLYDHVANKLPGTPGADDITGYVEYSVDMPAGLTWEAEIIEQSLPNSDPRVWKRHEGFFLDDDNEKVTTLTGQTPDKKLRVSFDKIYYPMVHWPNTPSGVVNSPNAEDYNIPRVTIAINVTGFEAGNTPSFATELVIEQVPLTAKPVDILNIYGGPAATTEVGGAYGAINNLNVDNTYFYMYSQALQAASYFSQTGWVRTPRANTKVGGESITDMSAGSTWVGNPSINVERNHIHASGFNRLWTETSLRRVEQWRTSAETDGFVFFVSDEVGAISLNGVASLGPWNMYGAGGEEPGGYNRTEAYTTAAESLYAPSADTRVMKYVLNGPFGTTSMESLNNAFAHDGIYSYAQTETITEQNPNAVILIKERNSLSNGHDHTLLVVDPTQRLAYAGEGQLFNNFGAIGSTLGTDDVTYPAKRKFRGNFMSIFINSAMYGSHFYDLLRDDCPKDFWVIRNTSTSTTPAATYSVNQID